MGISTEYVLADKYKRFYVNPTVWGNWGKFQPEKQEQHILNFFKPLPKPRKAQVITSQDGLMEIPLKARPIKLKPGTKGSGHNKAGQVKRTNNGESDESAPKRKRGRLAKK